MNLHETPAFTLVNWLIFTSVAALFISLFNIVIKSGAIRRNGLRRAFDDYPGGFWRWARWTVGSSAFSAMVILIWANWK